MSTINNLPTSTVVTAFQYNYQALSDILQRFGVERSVLPCIYNGYQVTIGSGLTVNVTEGWARGQDIPFTGMTGSPLQPTQVYTPAATVDIPASSTGYVVLNININPAPNTTASQYNVQPDNNAGTPVVGPVFVTTLQPAIGSVYPFTQVVLAKVVSGVATITSVDQTFSLGNRSFDYQEALASQMASDVQVATTFNQGAFDDGNAPSAANQLTNKTYVEDSIDGIYTITTNSNGVAIKNNVTGYIEQWGTVTLTATGGNPINATWTFPVPFTTDLINFQTTMTDVSSDSSVACTWVPSSSLVGIDVYKTTNAGHAATDAIRCYAFGK